MNTPARDHDDHSELREALWRDAARMSEPPFDPALHHATMRRIRTLPDAPLPGWRLVPALGAGMALLTAVLIFAHREPRHPSPDFAAVIASTENSIASFAMEPTAVLPGWISPTASLLDPPRLSE